MTNTEWLTEKRNQFKSISEKIKTLSPETQHHYNKLKMQSEQTQQNQMKTIAELRRAGFRIRVTHFRYINKRKKLTQKEIRDQFGSLRSVLARGGSTIIEVSDPNGKNGMGKAVCIKSDAFYRKTGIDIALSQALADLK